MITHLSTKRKNNLWRCFCFSLGLEGTDTSLISILQFVLLLSKGNLFLVDQLVAELKSVKTIITRLIWTHIYICLYLESHLV